MASKGQRRVVQLTGFRNEEKKELLQCLSQLDCVFLDNKKYRNCTHLIAKKLCKSEKFLAACAAGKWILTKDYVINSAKSGRWLNETTYEWGYQIEKDSHCSPQMQSAPKRWREELTRSGAPGAFHVWNVVLSALEDSKQMESIRRVLEAGSATICSSSNAEQHVTHIFICDKTSFAQSKESLSETPYYPLQYLGDYLLENEIAENIPKRYFLAAQETDPNSPNTQLAEAKKAVIRHMFFAAAMKQRVAQKVLLNKCNAKVKSTLLSRCSWHMLEELVEEHLVSLVLIEIAAAQTYSTPPIKIIESLLEYVLSGSPDAVLCAKFHHFLYLVLQHDPPWKSPSMLQYYLDLLQCPVCKKGTWSFIEMLMRSCLHCETICHTVPYSERGHEQRIIHKSLLKFFFNLIKAEVEFLTKRLVEDTNSQHQQVLPQTVLLRTFWTESDPSLLFTKHINILSDWVVLSHRELSKKNDAVRCEVTHLLNAILGTVVEYWINSNLLMDRNVFHEISCGLAEYLAVSCHDFQVCELKAFVCSIPSLWLQMFVAEAIFKQMCLQRGVTVSTEPLSLQKIVSSYFPALQELVMNETRHKHKSNQKKIGQWPCPKSQRALQMRNGDKQIQVKVLPDLPDVTSIKCHPLTLNLGPKRHIEDKENNCLWAEKIDIYKKNKKGETALHKACISNNVERLIQLLSFPGSDINAKDYAGWTPLHEACNHGSTVCVREILQRCPEVDLLSRVDGVTPLHDALSNGHVEIGKLLLQRGGPILLQQRDSNGKLPLDYVESVSVKQKLLDVVHPEEDIENFCEQTEQDFRSQQRELWFVLFSKMLLNLCSVYNLASPFTLTPREAVCSEVPSVTAYNSSEVQNMLSADWLVDMYLREREAFQKLPQFLQELSASTFCFPGEQMKALLAALQTMVEACQLFT